MIGKAEQRRKVVFQYLHKENSEIRGADFESPHLGKAVFAFEVVNGVFVDLVSAKDSFEGNFQVDGETGVF